MVYAAGTIILEVAPSFDGMQNSTKRAVRDSFGNMAAEVEKELAKVENVADKSGEEAGKKYGTSFGKVAQDRIKRMSADFKALESSLPEKKAAKLRTLFDALSKYDFDKAGSWRDAAANMETISKISDGLLTKQKNLSREQRIGLGAIRQQAEEIGKWTGAVEGRTAGPSLKEQQAMLAQRLRAEREMGAEIARRQKAEQKALDSNTKMQLTAAKNLAKWQDDRIKAERAAATKAIAQQRIMYGPGSLIDRFNRENAKKIAAEETAAQRTGATRLRAERELTAEMDRRAAAVQKAGVQQVRAQRENVEIDVKIKRDSVAREMAEVKREIATLGADIRLNPKLDTKEAMARILQLRGRLEQLDRMNVDPDIDVDVSGPIIQLRSLEAAAKRADRSVGGIGGALARLNATAGAANAVRLFSGALLTIVLIGPVLIPLLAGISAGILGVGAAALGVLGGIGVLVAAFSGIGGAVGAMNDLAKAQRTANAGGANKSAAADTRRAVQDARSLADAQRDLGRARREAAQGLADSAQRVTDAERKVADAQQSSLDAQLALNEARAQAVRDLEDMNNQLASARLNERGAEFAVEEAAVHLNVVLEDDQATQREKDVAQLQYEKAVQSLKEQRTETARLEVDTKKANAAGVEGSEQVVSAKDSITSANARILEAERSLAESRAEFAEQQIRSAERVGDAEENLRRTYEDIAMRGEEAALATGEVATATNNLAEAMRGLSPAGKAFALFLFSLKPLLDDLRFAAQEGFLPGLQRGMQLVLGVYGPGLVRFVGDVAQALGDLAEATAEMFVDPFWQDFFGFIADMAPDVIRLMGEIVNNLLTMFAGLFKAFAPVGMTMLEVLADVTEGWAEWGMTLESNKGFQDFMAYLEKTWPKVSELLGNLFELLIKVVVALEPYADRLLDIFIAVTDWLISMDPKTFETIIGFVFGVITAIQIAAGLVGLFAGVATLISSVAGIIALAIGAVAVAIAWLWTENEGFRDFVKGAWEDIQNAMEPVVTWMSEVAAPILGAFWDDITTTVEDDVIPALVTLWQNFEDGLKGTAEDDTWNVLNTLLDGLQANAEVTGPAVEDAFDGIAWTWTNVLVPALQVGWAIIEPIIRFLGGLFDVAAQVISRAVNAIVQIWTFILLPTLIMIWSKIEPIVRAFGEVWERDVVPKISGFVSIVSSIWNGLLDIFRTPIRLGIEYVINKGLIGAFNWLASKVPGMTPLDPVAIPDVLQPGGQAPRSKGGGGSFYEGGIMDGYTPGRDVHTFVSPTGGRLDLSGGEAVLVPELTKALGADWVHGANKAARRGEGLEAYLGGFAKGGIIGDVWDTITGTIGNKLGSGTRLVRDALADPAAMLRGIVEKSMKSIPGLGGFSGPFAEALAGVATKPIDGLAGLFGKAAEGSDPVPTPGAGVGITTMIGMLNSLGLPGARVNSTYRPGATVAGYGVQSFHALGRAIDIGGPNMMGIFEALNGAFGNRSQELLYTPAGGRQILRGGKRGNTSGVTAKNHYSHVHWAMADGGIVPTLYDTGGDVPPGLSVVSNKTQKPEVTLTNKFVEEVRGNINRGDGPTIDARGATFGADAEDIVDEWRKQRRDALALTGLLDQNLGVL